MIETSDEIALAAIEHGTVLDHIPSGEAMRLVRLLNLEALGSKVLIGVALPSTASGTKDLIKVEGWELTPEEVSKIAIFAPTTTVSHIREGSVVKKYKVALPQSIDGVIICPNSNCITQTEKTKRGFVVQQIGKKVCLRCEYCEMKYLHHQIQAFTV